MFTRRADVLSWAIILSIFSCGPACAAPLQYLTGAGARAWPVVRLTWGVLGVSLAVIVIIAGLLLASILRRRDAMPPNVLAPEGGGLPWLWIGAGVSFVALLATVVWTMWVLALIQAPAATPRVTIEVTGRQWWWQARYLSGDASRQFTTANEIHIPAGEPVRIRLVGGDVIHSFWVPQLSGKMDTIPGLVSETWIEAAAPGTYMGQCTEYCGVEHSRMLLRVIAQPRAEFDAWRTHQMAPASGDKTGQLVFVKNCGGCHAVRGTQANGNLGPDLSHLMQRRTLASAALPNNEAMLARWIADPQSLKPGNRMPAVPLTVADRSHLLAYLETLN